MFLLTPKRKNVSSVSGATTPRTPAAAKRQKKEKNTPPASSSPDDDDDECLFKKIMVKITPKKSVKQIMEESNAATRTPKAPTFFAQLRSDVVVVGRNTHVTKLNAWLRDPASANTPRVAILSGPSGSGKTHCAKHCLEQLNFTVEEISCSDFTNAASLHATLIFLCHRTPDWRTGRRTAVLLREVDEAAEVGNHRERLGVSAIEMYCKTLCRSAGPLLVICHNIHAQQIKPRLLTQTKLAQVHINFVPYTQKQLCKIVGVPSSSLDCALGDARQAYLLREYGGAFGKDVVRPSDALYTYIERLGEETTTIQNEKAQRAQWDQVLCTTVFFSKYLFREFVVPPRKKQGWKEQEMDTVSQTMDLISFCDVFSKTPLQQSMFHFLEFQTALGHSQCTRFKTLSSDQLLVSQQLFVQEQRVAKGQKKKLSSQDMDLLCLSDAFAAQNKKTKVSQ